jgi:hypothetical protein
MFYHFTDNKNIIRYIKFCEISEVTVTPAGVDTDNKDPYMQIFMGNGKNYIKSFTSLEDAATTADGVIRMAASYKRNSTKPATNYQKSQQSRPQQKAPYNSWHKSQ